jgi:hypothetical protein
MADDCATSGGAPSAKPHPLVVEQEKPIRERGFYQKPKLYSQPAEEQTEWVRHSQQMQRMKEAGANQQLHAQNQQQKPHPSELEIRSGAQVLEILFWH